MTKVSDITTTALSGLVHIDALLDIGPDWNYMTPAGNTILYTFSVSSGNEQQFSGQSAFSAAQQAGAKTAMDYISKLTGINFVVTSDGTAAQLHLCNMNIADANTTGLCSWSSSLQRISGTDTVVGYSAEAYVYLDNYEWAGRNADLSKGSDGYETLLHELGHALGLKHPFDGDIHLSAATDNTANTLMSYTSVGGAHSTFSQYDIAALNWLYGGDGLGGALGINSTTGARYITGTNAGDTLTGTAFNDTLEGDGGNDMINGGDGIDTAVFRGARDAYTFTQLSSGALLATSTDGSDGVDTLVSIEVLKFSNGSYQSSQMVDTVAPPAPTMNVTKNTAGYVVGNTAFVVGVAEAGASVKVYGPSGQVGSALADADGFWSLTTSPFADGLNYQIYARATDQAGNTSVSSLTQTFNVDAHAPSVPTGGVTITAGSNQPVFSGTGEAGTTIQLVNVDTLVGQATVAANGTWHVDASPLSNGNYNVTVISSDLADNATSAKVNLTFAVASTNNLVGTDGNDRLTPTAGNNAVEGGAGLDTAVYAGARANYTVAKDVNGFTITDQAGTNGLDSLVNIERIQFGDGSMIGLDINGVGGQAFRLYQAAFDRVPDLPGLGFWIKYMDLGMSLNEAAAQFMPSKEYVDKYHDTTNPEFITKLYANVLHRTPEQSGLDFWLKAIDDGHSRAEVLAFFSESPENQAQVIGSIQNGFEFIPHA
jgi:serralysin